MLKSTIPQKLNKFLRLLEPDEKGQSIVIIAFAILGLIAMLGLALDLGLVYIEQTRLKRALDAGVLAGVVELPSEEQTYIRAINYLDQNGYRLFDSSGIPLIRVNKTITNSGEIRVSHCQPLRTGTAISATPIQSTISPK